MRGAAAVWLGSPNAPAACTPCCHEFGGPGLPGKGCWHDGRRKRAHRHRRAARREPPTSAAAAACLRPSHTPRPAPARAPAPAPALAHQPSGPSLCPSWPQGLRVLLVDGCGGIDNVAISLRSPLLAYDGAWPLLAPSGRPALRCTTAMPISRAAELAGASGGMPAPWPAAGRPDCPRPMLHAVHTRALHRGPLSLRAGCPCSDGLLQRRGGALLHRGGARSRLLSCRAARPLAARAPAQGRRCRLLPTGRRSARARGAHGRCVRRGRAGARCGMGLHTRLAALPLRPLSPGLCSALCSCLQRRRPRRT